MSFNINIEILNQDGTQGVENDIFQINGHRDILHCLESVPAKLIQMSKFMRCKPIWQKNKLSLIIFYAS